MDDHFLVGANSCFEKGFYLPGLFKQSSVIIMLPFHLDSFFILVVDEVILLILITSLFSSLFLMFLKTRGWLYPNMHNMVCVSVYDAIF